MSKVFILETPRQGIDVSKAEDFGKIFYVFGVEDRRCSVWSHVRFGQTVLQRLEKLNFDSKTDYICIVGALVPVSIAIITVAQRYDDFNILLFNSVDDSYVQKRFCKWNY